MFYFTIIFLILPLISSLFDNKNIHVFLMGKLVVKHPKIAISVKYHRKFDAP